MSADMQWEDPPPRRHYNRFNWAEIGAALKARPGEWAKVAVSDNPNTAAAMAAHIRNGKYIPLAALGRFEAKSRQVDGEARVYARYVGERE